MKGLFESGLPEANRKKSIPSNMMGLFFCKNLYPIFFSTLKYFMNLSRSLNVKSIFIFSIDIVDRATIS